MQQLVDILEDYLQRNFNEDTLKVFRQLWMKSNVSEFDIAEHLRLSINYVRNLLYGLHAFNMVNSTRKKDRQKGWYIYYWTFNVKHAVGLILQEKQQQLVALKKSRGEESKERYACPDGHVTFNAVRALEHGFKCPECEKLLVRQVTRFEPEVLQAREEGLRREIEFLQQPLLLQEKPEKKAPRPKAKQKKKILVKKTSRKIKKLKKKITRLQKKLTKTKKPRVQKKLLKKIRGLKVKKKILKQGKKPSRNPLPKVRKMLKPQLKRVSPAQSPTKKPPVKDAQKSGLLSKLRKKVGF